MDNGIILTSQDSLFSKTLKATRVMLLVTSLKAAFQLGAQLVLVRIIASDVFGLFAFSQMVVGFFALLASLNGPKFVMLRKDDFRRTVNIVFTIEAALGIIFTVALIGLSSTIARLLGKTEITLYVQVLAISFLIDSFILVPRAVFERELNYQKASISILTEVVVNTIVSIYLACFGLTIWALIYGIIAGKIAEIIVLWRMLPFTMRFEFNRPIFRNLFKFGLPLSLFSLSSYAYTHIDDLLVGKILGFTQLGYYWLAYNFPHYLLAFQSNIANVTFPAFASANDNAQLKRGFEKAVKVSASVFFLPCIIILTLGRPIVKFVFGPQWLPATVCLKIFMITVCIRAVITHWTGVYSSKGKTSALLFNLLNLAIIPLLGYYFMLLWGISGMAIAVLVSVILSIPLSKVALGHYFKFSYLKIIWPQLKISILALSCGILFARLKMESIWGLGLSLLCILSVYFAGVYLLDREIIYWLKPIITSRK